MAPAVTEIIFPWLWVCSEEERGHLMQQVTGFDGWRCRACGWQVTADEWVDLMDKERARHRAGLGRDGDDEAGPTSVS